jgi:hypothetical protein
MIEPNGHAVNDANILLIQPILQQHRLGTFTRTVDSLDNKKVGRESGVCRQFSF